MKKLLGFFALVIVLASCSKGVAPDEPIGLSAAFAYCAGLTSYWVWGIATTLVVGVVLYLYFKKVDKKSNFVLFAAIALIAAAWLYAPSEVAWNTTVEQAARGVYIR